MKNVYFGEFTDGRLKRLQFLGYALLLAALVLGFMFAVVLAIGAGEHLIGGDLQQAQNKLRDWFGLPATIIVILFALAAFVAKLNIMAKRIRDMGLSGWWIVLALLLVTGGTSATTSEQTGSAVFCVFTILLVLIPSNTFGKKASG